MAIAAPARRIWAGQAPEPLLAAGLAFGCALIHLQAAADHLNESRLYAGLFVVVAAAQGLWGAAILRRPNRRMVWAGLVGSLLVIAAWCASRTVGLPVGPDLAGPEAASLLDVLATLDELALVALLVPAFRRGSGGGGGNADPEVGAGVSVGATAIRAVALTLVLATSLVLAGGVHAH